MRTTLRIDDELARRAKSQAALEGTTLTALIEQALREALHKRELPSRAPIDLPTSGKGGDGVREGVDLANGRALRDLMDGLG